MMYTGRGASGNGCAELCRADGLMERIKPRVFPPVVQFDTSFKCRSACGATGRRWVIRDLRGVAGEIPAIPFQSAELRCQHAGTIPFCGSMITHGHVDLCPHGVGQAGASFNSNSNYGENALSIVKPDDLAEWGKAMAME